jgi:hypothetical protein
MELSIAIFVAMLVQGASWEQKAIERFNNTGEPPLYRQFVALFPQVSTVATVLEPYERGTDDSRFFSGPLPFIVGPDGRLYKKPIANPISRNVLDEKARFDEIVHKRHDKTELRRFVHEFPRRLRSYDLDQTSFSVAREILLTSGLLLSDLEGDQRAVHEWLTLKVRTSPGSSDDILPIYAVRAGFRSPGLVRDVSLKLRRHTMDASSFFAGPVPEVEHALPFWAEISAGYSCYFSLQQEVHARRALAMNKRQAHSAVILMPILTRTGRAEEALKIGDEALRFATGRAKKLIELSKKTAQDTIHRDKARGKSGGA